MSNHQNIDVDRFILDLEEMIDARDDMWEEEKYSNVHLMDKIKTTRYEPAKERVRIFLKILTENIKITA